MKDKNSSTHTSAAGITASIFGVLAGLGGMVHGVGEMRQGNVAPAGLLINSWTQGPIATSLGGEPGMTIVPNLLVTGTLTVIVSLTILVWAAAFVRRKNGGWVLIGLSIMMLLMGGGFAPPIIGVLTGVAGLGIGARHTWWRAHLAVGVRRVFAYLWPWVFGICVINGIFLVIGSVILVYFFGVNDPQLFVNSFLLAILLLLLTILTGVAHDIQIQSNPGVLPGVRTTP